MRLFERWPKKPFHDQEKEKKKENVRKNKIIMRQRKSAMKHAPCFKRNVNESR